MYVGRPVHRVLKKDYGPSLDTQSFSSKLKFEKMKIVLFFNKKIYFNAKIDLFLTFVVFVLPVKIWKKVGYFGKIKKNFITALVAQTAQKV